MPDPAKDDRRASPSTAPTRRPVWFAAGLLALLTGAVFFPVARFGMVDWDSYAQVRDNEAIKGLTRKNLRVIFTERCITSYYPVRTLSYAIDYEIGGLHPGVFKVTNVLIHLANVLLVFWMVQRLYAQPRAPSRTRGRWWDLSVAAFCAGVYAVHPVVVEPVVWIPGREELLMTLGVLGCFHFHLSATELGRKPGRTAASLLCRAGAFFCCAAAAMSNAVAAVIPALIVAWDLLTLPRPRFWRIVAGTAPLWAVSVATIVVKQAGEPAIPIEPGVFTSARVRLVATAYWLNLKTLAWPNHLSLYYNWIRPPSFLAPRVVAGGLAILATLAILWLVRRQKMLLFGLLWFALALAPYAQVMPHFIERADRFLYLPLIGLAVALAMMLRPLGAVLQSRVGVAGTVVAGVLVWTLLAVRSAGQVQTWRNTLSAWENCIRLNPDNYRAHDAYADNLVAMGRLDMAIGHYETVLKALPNCVETLDALAVQLGMCNERFRQFRDYDRAVKLGTRLNELTLWKNEEFLNDLAAIFTQRALDFQAKKDYGQAIQDYRNAMNVDPQFEGALFNLALLLATCPDPTLRRPEEAIRLAQNGIRTLRPPDVNSHLILATAYAQARQFNLAALTMEKAISMAHQAGREDMVPDLRLRLNQYRNGEAPLPPLQGPVEGERPYPGRPPAPRNAPGQ